MSVPIYFICFFVYAVFIFFKEDEEINGKYGKCQSVQIMNLIEIS